MPELDVKLLEPTKENALEAFVSNYLFRSKNVWSILDIIYDPNRSTVIAIDGDWGSGKTFFLRELEVILFPGNEQNGFRISNAISKFGFSNYGKGVESIEDCSSIVPLVDSLYPFYFDAWKSDYQGDPLIALILAMTHQFTIECEKSDELLSIASKLVKAVSTFSFSFGPFSFSPGEMIEAFKDNGENSLEFVVSSAAAQEQTQSLIKKYIEEVLRLTNRKGLVLIIDELDRCRPTFAVELLERIKHYFDIPGISFVIGVNINQLQNTIRNHYGQSFDAKRYLKRFFDFRIKLPVVTTEMFQNHYCYEFGDNNHTILDALCDHYQLSLRDRIQLHTRLVKLGSLSIIDYQDYRDRPFGREILIPLLLVLDYVDEDAVNDFLHGKNSAPLTDLTYTNAFRSICSLLGLSSINTERSEVREHLENIYTCWFSPEGNETYKIDKIEFRKQSVLNMLNKISFLFS
ncbi:KAP family P-loop NTPase fold protein [Ileibacterium valens]|uniref:KAP family P-loop NTPase fold protein n=1 Tax=Ileibacterium valens TaxID=1862668 RepID=UPI00259B7567|nr:P-loop NTPase fold protein [Ileibacterium valens]